MNDSEQQTMYVILARLHVEKAIDFHRDYCSSKSLFIIRTVLLTIQNIKFF